SGSAAKAVLLFVQVRPGTAADDAVAHAEATRRALENATRAGDAVLASSRLLPGALPPLADVRAGAFAVLAHATDESSRRAELLKAATGTKDLDNRIEAENRIALEDSAPAARVRAYDYLASRVKAPAGYDPLGAPRERRAALEKALAAPPTPAPTAQPAAAP